MSGANSILIQKSGERTSKTEALNWHIEKITAANQLAHMRSPQQYAGGFVLGGARLLLTMVFLIFHNGRIYAHHGC
jgi:hypothetical protein